MTFFKTSAEDTDATQLGLEESRDSIDEERSLPTTPGDGPPLISFVIPDLTLGGAEQVTITIINGLSARGYDVELLLSRLDGELEERLSDQISVVELRPSRTPVLGFAWHLPALAAYVRNREPAAMFPQLGHVNVVCLAINQLLDVDTAIVPTHHKAFMAATDQTPKDRFVRKLIPYLYTAADQISAVSRGVADSIVEATAVDDEDVSVLHNPVDIESVCTRAQERVNHEWVEDDDLDVILFVGRLERQKNLKAWLRVFQKVHQQIPTTRAIIAGQGSRRGELLSEVERLGLEDVVSLPGFVDNPYRFMNRASVFLLTSRYEGLPTVLVEALACGCPVVATDCPSGPREILDDGSYGHLVPVNDVDGLAEAVLNALDNTMRPERLQQRASEFTPGRVLDRYEAFIQKHVMADQ